MKDLMCICAYQQEILIWFFFLGVKPFLNLEAIYIPFELWPKFFVRLRWNWFFVRLPITNSWNCFSLYTAFSSNVGGWGTWACSLFLSISNFNNLLFPPWHFCTGNKSMESVEASPSYETWSWRDLNVDYDLNFFQDLGQIPINPNVRKQKN